MDLKKLLKNFCDKVTDSLKEGYFKSWSVCSLLVVVFAVGFVGGTLLRSHSIDTANIALREKNGNYKLTNPLLLCDTAASPQDKEYQNLKGKIESIINDRKEQSVLKRASIYYRDLVGGRWVGINENDLYSPASLLKVPTMIAFLKFAQENPDALKKEIFYDGSFDDNRAETIKPLKEIKARAAYTEGELINRMIAYSDNNATRLLDGNIDQSFLREVYTDLGITTPTLHGPVDFMSVKNYSYFFRILYNASYLNREMSEKALSFLSAPDFPQGIEGGLPSNISTAQKFGERVVFYKNNPTPATKELHDCGIVYYPEHPYLLCVMTEGDDFDKLTGVIRDISKVVYDDVKSTTAN